MASYPTRCRVRTTDDGYRKCESQKRGFPTRESALNAAEAMMDQGRVKPGCHIMPYFHGPCREWHLGNRVIVPMPGFRRANRAALD